MLSASCAFHARLTFRASLMPLSLSKASGPCCERLRQGGELSTYPSEIAVRVQQRPVAVPGFSTIKLLRLNVNHTPP